MIPCTLTFQGLSELLLIHITTCTKLVAQLEAEGVIERSRTAIHVLDAERLAACGLEEGR